MLRNCEPRLLFKEENFFISQCDHCKRLSLSFHNLLLGFTTKEFKRLSQLILKLRFYENCILDQDNDLKIVLNTGHKDIQCYFDQKEFKLLKRGLTESLLLLETHTILSSPKQ